MKHTYNLQHGGAGWAIRVSRNRDAWVLATHTSYSLQRIHDGTVSSAKLCTHTEGPGGLGAGSDGRLWCSANADGSRATKVDAAGTHGRNHRLSPGGVVDGYSLSLAAGPTGRVWFTDDSHNAIVRVSPRALMGNNVALGHGSTLLPVRTGDFKKYKHPRHVRKHHTFTLRHNCPHKASKCWARVKTRTTHKIHGERPKVARTRIVKNAAGHHHCVKLELTKRGRELIGHHRILKVTLRLYLPHHKHASAKRTIRLHR